MMKYSVTKFFGLLALFATLTMFSCTESSSIDYTEVEQEIFDDWMAKYYPELLDNRQDDGYYIDLVSVGDTSGIPIRDSICWVEYDMTGYDLYGNVSVTRNDVVAWQQGTYSDYTHYTPYYRLSDPDYDEDEDDDLILECSHLAFTSYLTIDGQSDVVLYNGAEFTLYSPSSLASTSGTDGSGGYDGQFTLSTLPFICKIKVVSVVYQPTTHENELVNAFAMINGGVSITSDSFNNVDIEDDEDEDEDTSDEDTSDEDEVIDTNAWTNPTPYVSHLYLNKYYSLNFDGAAFNYINPYTSTVPTSPYYDGIAALDAKIALIVEELFDDDYDSDGIVVGEDEDEQDATVWYICRLLDGYIVDTNIAKVKDLIYNTSDSTGSAISYDAEDDEDSYIAAWFYAIPYMRFGNWAAIVTTSSYAYGSDGVNGDTTYSSSSYSNYYNYYSSYYSGYSSYYGNSSYYSYTDSSVDTSSITTEILPFAPLIFQIYVEAEDDDD